MLAVALNIHRVIRKMSPRLSLLDEINGIVHAPDDFPVGAAGGQNTEILAVKFRTVPDINFLHCVQESFEEFGKPHPSDNWNDDRVERCIVHQQSKPSLLRQGEKVSAP